jgi:chaperonin cofactor prefoldin
MRTESNPNFNPISSLSNIASNLKQMAVSKLKDLPSINKIASKLLGCIKDSSSEARPASSSRLSTNGSKSSLSPDVQAKCINGVKNHQNVTKSENLSLVDIYNPKEQSEAITKFRNNIAQLKTDVSVAKQEGKTFSDDKLTKLRNELDAAKETINSYINKVDLTMNAIPENVKSQQENGLAARKAQSEVKELLSSLPSRAKTNIPSGDIPEQKAFIPESMKVKSENMTKPSNMTIGERKSIQDPKLEALKKDATDLIMNKDYHSNERIETKRNEIKEYIKAPGDRLSKNDKVILSQLNKELKNISQDKIKNKDAYALDNENKINHYNNDTKGKVLYEVQNAELMMEGLDENDSEQKKLKDAFSSVTTAIRNEFSRTNIVAELNHENAMEKIDSLNHHLEELNNLNTIYSKMFYS